METRDEAISIRVVGAGGGRLGKLISSYSSLFLMRINKIGSDSGFKDDIQQQMAELQWDLV